MLFVTVVIKTSRGIFRDFVKETKEQHIAFLCSDEPEWVPEVPRGTPYVNVVINHANWAWDLKKHAIVCFRAEYVLFAVVVVFLSTFA